MGASLLITLREGLEIALVLAILLSYMVKSGRGNEAKAVWMGAGIAAAACVAVGIAINITVDGLHGKTEQAVEGSLAVAACGVLTWMIFWMRRNSKSLGGELRAQVDSAVTVSGLAIIAFVAVAREGLETVLFLLGAETQTTSGSGVVVGGLIGLAIAAVLGFYFYKVGHRLNLKTFFTITAVLLILFAAGLAGKAAHEFRELLGFEGGWLFEPAWTIGDGADSTGTFYDFMKGLFGWHNEPERIRVIAYFIYLMPFLIAFLKPTKNGAGTSTATVAETTTAV